jgi:hypothetical protein
MPLKLKNCSAGRSQLGKEITSLSENRSQFIAAIDFMILGI